jgi:hypothetical protein
MMHRTAILMRRIWLRGCRSYNWPPIIRIERIRTDFKIMLKIGVNRCNFIELFYLPQRAQSFAFLAFFKKNLRVPCG